MPDVTPARWYAHRHPATEAADVLVPVARSEAADWPDLGPMGPIAVRLPDGPGDVATHPGTVTVSREEDDCWLGRRVGRQTTVVPILRVTADDWAALANVSRRLHEPVPPLTDLHTGCAWQVREWGPLFGPGPAATADPTTPYEVRWPPTPEAEALYRDTFAVLHALTGPHTPRYVARAALADVYPLAGWDVPNPYREARP